MAAKTKQAAFGKGLETYQVFGFKKGLNISDNPLQLAVARNQDSLRLADNMTYMQSSGAVSKRSDIERLTLTSLGASVAITGGYQYVKSDGNRFIVFGTDDGRFLRLNADGTTTAILTGATTGTRWYFTTYNDKLIFCNRADAPRKSTDATTSAVLPGTPPATGGPVAVHSNRVFFLDGTNKSRLTWSALNNEEDYTTANNAGFVDVNLNDGSFLVDIVPSINEMILLKENRPYRLQGTSPATYAITNVIPTTGSKGAVSTKGNVFAINDVWYLGNNGVLNLRTVLNFGDLKASYASDRISNYWFPNDPHTLQINHLNNAVSAYDGANNVIYYGVNSINATNGHNDLMLVIDLHTNGWSVWPDVGAASLWPVYNSTTGITEIYMGGYDGHVYRLNQDLAVNAFRGEARHLSALNAPGVQKSPRHGYFYFKEEGDFTVIIDTKFDFGASGGQVYVASLLGGSHTLGVNWVLGVDPLGARDQIVKRIDMSGLGEFIEVGVKNENAGEPFTWYGYEILWRPRRAVRPSGGGSSAGGTETGWGFTS